MTFVHGISEFRSFVESYVPGVSYVLGDVGLFDGRMRSMLLKFLEDNPGIDCYSSVDIGDPVLLSRFSEVVKVPLELSCVGDLDGWRGGVRDYASAVRCLDMSWCSRLLVVGSGYAGDVDLLLLDSELRVVG